MGTDPEERLEELIDHIKLTLSESNDPKKELQTYISQLLPQDGKTADGDYKEFIESGTGQTLKLIRYVVQKLEKYDMLDKAKELDDHYSIGDDTWMETTVDQ
jgi:hypothetical protein